MTNDTDILGDEARCANCRYSVRGLVSPVCPECGADLSAAKSMVLPGTARWGFALYRFALWTLVFLICCVAAAYASWLVLPVVHHKERHIHVNSSKSGGMSEYFYIETYYESVLPRILTFVDQRWEQVDVAIRSRTNYTVEPIAKMSLCVDKSANELMDCSSGQPVSNEDFHDWLADIGIVLANERAIAEANAIWYTVESVTGKIRAGHLAEYFNIFDRGYVRHKRVSLIPKQELVATCLIVALFVFFWLRRSIRVFRHCWNERTSLDIPAIHEA